MAGASAAIDHAAAREILAAAWDKTDNAKIVAPAKIVPFLEAIIEASDVTYKYLLVTGILAKCTNPEVHPRAIQAASNLAKPFDARSLCHDVVVGFEKTKGDLWGLSNEPYLNKPARHTEHYKTNTQLRNKPLAATLHDALEYLHKATKEEVSATLVHVLRLSKARAATHVIASSSAEQSYQRVTAFVEKFLKETNGGTHLVALMGAFVSLLNGDFDVRVYPPTYSDKFAKTWGDVEIRKGKIVVSAYECKQRPLNLDDIKHGIKKANEGGVLEYCFVYSAGLANGQEDAIRQEVVSHGKQRDVLLIDAHATIKEWISTLNPIRRSSFGGSVVALLREKMHRSDIADKAGELWNSLE